MEREQETNAGTATIRKRCLLPGLLFLAVFATHAGSKVRMPFDSRWVIPTAVSLIDEHDADLDEYAPLLRAHHDYAVERIGGHAYNLFPIGTALTAVPFVWFMQLPPLRAVGLDVRALAAQGRTGTIESVIASFLVALTALCLYAVGRSIDLTRPRALALAAVFAFCTPAWSTASRALWQHAPSMLLLSLALLCLLQARARRPRLAAAVPALLCFAFIVRPTNAVPAALLMAAMLPNRPRQLVWGLLPAAALAALFVGHNLATRGAPLPAYYLPGRVGHGGRFLEALAGNLVSPNRGLFVFAPVLAAAVPGAVNKLRRRRPPDPLDAALAACIAGHWLLISSFPHWWAGHSVGPRLFTDMLPFLVYFLAPALQPGRRGSVAGLPGLRLPELVLLAAVSLWINGSAANNPGVLDWNATPRSVDEQPSRVWDWRDLQFLRRP